VQVLQHILALVIKELRALLLDKRSRLVLIVPPVIQLLVFGYAATFDVNHVPFAVYDADDSGPSRSLVARFAGSGTFDYLGALRTDHEMAQAIDNRRALMVLRLEPDFGRRLARGQSTDVQLVVDGRNSNTALIVLNYARNVLIDFNRDWAAANGLPEPPARLQIRAWFNENLVSRWFVVPGIVALLTLVVTMVVTALSVAREREAGTFDQLLVTPLRPAEILIGKALPGFLIGTIEATFIIVVTVFWFDVPLRGALLPLYLGIWLFLLSAVGVGLMISSLSVTQQQGLLGAFLFLVPAVILSGFATPIENMPSSVQLLTYLNPMRYFLVIVRSVFLQGADIGMLVSQYWPMAAIGVATLAVAGWLFRHRMY
jgi:ABC-2 type transport system permease protein